MPVSNPTLREFNFAGSKVRLLISGEQSSGAFCMLEMTSPSGRSTPMHRHDREEETVYVLEGVLTVTLAGVEQPVSAGETILLPRYLPHRLANTSDGPARYLVVCTPAGFDEFVQTCATILEDPENPLPPQQADVLRMKEAAPLFGITLLPGERA